MVRPRPVAAVFLLSLGLFATGCAEFPCVDAVATAHTLPTVTFAPDGDSLRYTYWFEDGAQRVVFDREEIPETARHSVLVHVPPKTSGELHGAVGWVTDVSSESEAAARLYPMALARARALNAWRGRWRVRWFETRAGLIAAEMATRLELEANLDAAQLDEPADDAPEELGVAPAAELGTDENPPARKEQTIDGLPSKVAGDLADEGISFPNLKRDRALRVIGAREPLPPDFGLSIQVDLHTAWLFVDDDCDACGSATDWLDQHDIGHHIMRVSDPTNARTLRDLAQQANIEPAVPMLWDGDVLVRGFEVRSWTDHVAQRKEKR